MDLVKFRGDRLFAFAYRILRDGTPANDVTEARQIVDSIVVTP